MASPDLEDQHREMQIAREGLFTTFLIIYAGYPFELNIGIRTELSSETNIMGEIMVFPSESLIASVMRFLAPHYIFGRCSDVSRVHIVGATLIMTVNLVPMKDCCEIYKNNPIHRDHCGVPGVQNNVFVLPMAATVLPSLTTH